MYPIAKEGTGTENDKDKEMNMVRVEGKGGVGTHWDNQKTMISPDGGETGKN